MGVNTLATEDYVMAKSDRWKQAQSYEKHFWHTSPERSGTDGSVDYSWYKWRADKLKNLLELYQVNQSILAKDSRVLEIGSGPVGTIAYFKAKERYAIDPLCDFYSTQPALIKLRDKNVGYKNGRGEKLDFDDEYFDLIIMENVIDHTEDIEAVISEVLRVLKLGAILYLTVNLHPYWGAQLHKIVSYMQIDKGHPHTFTIKKIRDFLNSEGLSILFDEHENFLNCLKNDFMSNSLKNKVKAISGLSEYLYTCLSQKPNS